LRAARLNRGLSVEDAARQLRLSVRQITALEEDDYSKLVSNTFLRGFVRNYAKLLQIDASPLLQQLERSAPPPPVQTITYQSEGIPFPSNRKQGVRSFLIVGGAILALVLLIYEIYRGNEVAIDNQQPAPRTEPQAGVAPEAAEPPSLPMPASTSPVDDGNDGKTEPSFGDRGAIEQKSMTPSPGSDSASISTSIPVQQVAPAGSVPDTGEWKDTLHLVFGGESWTEVKDSRGRVLLSRINLPGTEQFLRGKPPFFLAIGNAVAVQLVYNGKSVDLLPYTNRYGGTARLSLE
jgi:cytoskeleton protein RodZ